MIHAPTTRRQYEDIVAQAYREFPSLISWVAGKTGLRFYADFTINPLWFPSVWRLLDNLKQLQAMNLIDPPVFRDFKDKRGLLSIYYDGGDELSEMLIEGVEEIVNRR